MCGILGGIGRNGVTDRDTIRAALEVMKRRGPDAQGVYERAPVFFGHRRLSIIDLDALSHAREQNSMDACRKRYLAIFQRLTGRDICAES